MKIISAGFPKTGTKSASEALRRDFHVLIGLRVDQQDQWKSHFRILGYSVCDVLDSAHSGIAKNWLDFMNGESTIEEVVEAYHRNGYGTNSARIFLILYNLFSDATQDLPGNLYWESLLKACPGQGSMDRHQFEN